MSTKRFIAITGASRGLGFELARLLVGAGHVVAGCSRHGTESNSHQSTSSHTFVLRRCDVRDPAQVRSFFDWIGAEWGRLDVLINNAGIGTFLPLDETSDALWNDMIDTNLSGAFRCIRAALPWFRRAGGGLIVNISSIAGVRGFPLLSAYCASKAGLRVLGEAVAEELRLERIHVCTVVAGAIATSFWDRAGAAAQWDRANMVAPAAAAARIVDVIEAYPEAIVEEIRLMPPCGILEPPDKYGPASPHSL